MGNRSPTHVTGHLNQVVFLTFQFEVKVRTDHVERNCTVIHKKRGSSFVIIALQILMDFWATVCKTVRPMLSDRCLFCVPCLSICPVCDVGVLWPNGWMDQDETWQGGRPRPWSHCVRWRPSSPPVKGHNTQFLIHICCGQMA